MRTEFSRAVLPVRLIDIAATLLHAPTQGGIHFVVPSSWHFHVISHTWSLELRDLSEQIGQQIMQKLNHGANQASIDVITDAQPSANEASIDAITDAQPSANHSTHQAPHELIVEEPVNVLSNDITITPQPSSARLYNAYFEQADLRGKPAFHGLIEFLSLLAKEDIAYVWFDALCINQTSQHEKEHEIANMGAYYSNSIGCYVVVHGIGQGYHFWNSNDFVGALPRWFSRVWTLQELFLPAKLTFVLELPERVQRYIQGLIERNSNSLIGFCRCCILKGLLQELQDALDPMERLNFLNSCGIEVEFVKLSEGTQNKEIVFPKIPIHFKGDTSAICGDGRACPACSSSSLITPCKPQQCNTGKGKDYPFMVERDAYLFLMYLDTFFPLNGCYGSIPRIFSLIKILEKQEWDPCNVFSDIGRRDCTNDEDRVLGVLGLLGVEGDMQVRTGEAAEDQLVNLGRYCITNNHQELLLKLCVVEPVGGPILGMSWAPSVRYRDFAYEYMGDVCGFSFEFIEDCFGRELDSDSDGDFSNSEFEQEVDDSTLREDEPHMDDTQVLNMSIFKASLDEVMSQLDRLSNVEQKVDFLDCTHSGITIEACVAAGRILPYMRLKSHEREIIKHALSKLNASTPSIINANHIPTHCIRFEKSGVCLPLMVSLFKARNRVTKRLEPVLVMVDAVRPWNMIYLSVPNCTHAIEALERFEDFLHCVEDTKIRIEVDVQVVLLGIVGDYSVLMVCVGHTFKKLRKLGMKIPKLMELNKVGTFVLPKVFTKGLFTFSEGSKVRYLVGGHGEDLSMFVQMRCIKCGTVNYCMCGMKSNMHTHAKRKHYCSAKKTLNVHDVKEKPNEMILEASSSVAERDVSIHVSLYKNKN